MHTHIHAHTHTLQADPTFAAANNTGADRGSAPSTSGVAGGDGAALGDPVAILSLVQEYVIAK